MAVKPNTKFELDIRDIEIIESALRAKAGRRGLAIAQGETSEKLKAEMLEINDLHSYYGDAHILRGVNMKVSKGKVVALLGRNGMGKTTLLSVIAGVLQPQKGYIEIDGMKRRESLDTELEIRRRAVFLPDQCWLPKNHTGREYLIRVGKLYDIVEGS